MKVKFANSALKHYVTKSEILKIIKSKTGFKIGQSRENMDKIAWIGDGDLGKKIEIIAIDFISYQYVIHAMPIEKRGGELDEKMDHLW